MKRLLNVNTYHYRKGGSDAVYFEHALAMEACGFENGYFAMKHPLNERTSWESYFIEELEFGQPYSLLRKLGMATKVIYSFEARSRLARLLDDFSPDIAHLHCIYHHLSPSILSLLSSRGVPTVMTTHDLKIACPAYKMLNREGICERCRDGSYANVVRHRCVRNSVAASVVVAMESSLHSVLRTYHRYLSAIVSPSLFFIDKFVEWGWNRKRFVHIPNFVHVNDFSPNYLPGEYALYFGRLVSEKGLSTLIKAAARSRIPLVLAGTGPDEFELRGLAEEIRAPVSFAGFRSGRDLHDLVRGARCVVLPSEIYENSPMSVLESMALGKIIIGARIGGIPELITDGETGWLFDSGSIDSLAGRLDTVKNCPTSVIQAMGMSGRARVESQYSRERYVTAMLDLYAGLGVAPDKRMEPAATTT